MRALVLAALVLAGCATPQAEPTPTTVPTSSQQVIVESSGLPGLGEEPYADPATFGMDECNGLGSWTQPDLFERLGGRPDSRRVTPEPHMPFDPIAAGIPERARYITYFGVDRGRDSIFIFVDEGRPTLAALVVPERTREEARALFDRFTNKTLDLDASEADALFDAFWASRTPGELVGPTNVSRYSLDAPVGSPRVERAIRELVEEAPPNASQVGSGRWLRIDADGGRWEARLLFAERRIVIDAPEGRLVLRVTEQPRASAFSPASHGDEQAFIRHAMEHAGLPSPTFEGWTRDLGVC